MQKSCTKNLMKQSRFNKEETMGRRKVITEADFEDVKKLRNAGWSYSRIGEKYGVSAVSIFKYLSGKTEFNHAKSAKNTK